MNLPIFCCKYLCLLLPFLEWKGCLLRERWERTFFPSNSSPIISCLLSICFSCDGRVCCAEGSGIRSLNCCFFFVCVCVLCLLALGWAGYMRACINAHFHTYVMSQLLKTARRFRENGSRKRKTYCIECIISRTLSRTAQVWEVGASLSAKGFGVDFVVLTAFLLSPACLCFPSIASASR